MSNVIRLVNGGSIQVRTGVIQGIGPQGPRGISGPQGPDGPTGPQGEQGNTGAILQMQAKTGISSSNAITANTDTQVIFGSVSYDDLSCMTSSSAITLSSPGDYMLSVFLRFDASTATKREAWWLIGGSTLIARQTVMADTGITYVNLNHAYRAVGGESIAVFVRSGSATAISLGSYTVTRMGSGPVGAQGPTGAQGIQGPIGPAGPTGPSGTANAGYSTYALLLPH